MVIHKRIAEVRPSLKLVGVGKLRSPKRVLLVEDLCIRGTVRKLLFCYLTKLSYLMN